MLDQASLCTNGQWALYLLAVRLEGGVVDFSATPRICNQAMISDNPTESVTASGPDQQVRQATPVVVDPGFVRAIADHTAIMNLGRDADLVFFAQGSAVMSIAGLTDDSLEMMAAELRPQLNEVARIRMSPLSAVTLAMQILHEYTQRGGLNTAMVVEQLTAWSSTRDGKASEEQA